MSGCMSAVLSILMAVLQKDRTFINLAYAEADKFDVMNRTFTCKIDVN